MPSALHQLTCYIAREYPGTIVQVADAIDVPLPGHDRPEPAPGSHHMNDKIWQRLAGLYLESVIEEARGVTMHGERLLLPDTLERLRGAEAEADARVAKAKAEADERVAKAKAQAVADNLMDFLAYRGDSPSGHAITTISACQSTAVLSAWLKRAYRGDTSAEIFPEP